VVRRRLFANVDVEHMVPPADSQEEAEDLTLADS